MVVTTDSARTPVWRLDLRLKAEGESVLRSVKAVSQDEIWVVGNTVRHHSRALVARWTGEFHLVRPAPADARAHVVLNGVSSTADAVWAVGQISFGTNDMRTRVERFSRHGADHDGKVVDCPSPRGNSALRGVAMLSPEDGWAVGAAGAGTLTVHWDGAAWHRVPSPDTGALNAVAARATDDVWAVGHHAGESLVLHWNGTAWRRVPVPPSPTGADELLDVATVGRDSVWVVGTSGTESGVHTALAMRWDGRAWQSVPAARDVTQYSAVSARSDTEVWLAGYAEAPGAREHAHIARWNGNGVTTTGTVARPRDNVASALEDLTAETRHMIAVGWHVGYHSPEQQPAAYVATD